MCLYFTEFVCENMCLWVWNFIYLHGDWPPLQKQVINSYRAGWFLKCSFLLKSEVYPVFLLLYLSSTALKLIGVNRKVVRKFIFYPHITKWLNFALKFLILISFSSALFLQLERIRNTIHLYGQMHIFIKNVRINVKFTPKNSM